MATIMIEDVPESIVKTYGKKIKFSYDLSFQNDFDIDFRELNEDEITPEILKSIEITRNKPKSEFINLSRECDNY